MSGPTRKWHRYAVDATVAATALAAPGPVTVLTSRPEDLMTLRAGRATVVSV